MNGLEAPKTEMVVQSCSRQCSLPKYMFLRMRGGR
jgi:hypothetical protein